MATAEWWIARFGQSTSRPLRPAALALLRPRRRRGVHLGC
jgi:hypothetical protein